MKKYLIALAVLAMMFLGPWINYALTKNLCTVWPDLKPEDVRGWMFAVQVTVAWLTGMFIFMPI